MSKPILLLMTGGMGSGKSVGADFLVDHRGASRWSRTELMKRLAHAVADQIGDPDEVLHRIFPDPATREIVGNELLDYVRGYKPENGKPRRLYQDITQICQDHDPLCFERELDQRIKSTGTVQFSLIDDVRNAAGFEYFTAQHYGTVRIDAPEQVCRQRMLARDGYLPPEETFQHPSETELRDVPHDFHIDNSTDDPAKLFRALDDVLKQITGREPEPVDYDTIAAAVMSRLKARRRAA